MNITNNEDHINTVVEAGAIPLLMSLLRDGINDHKDNAGYALGNIVKSKEAASIMVEVDVIPALMAHLKSGAVGRIFNAGRAFAKIAKHDQHNEKILNAGVIPVLIELIKGGDIDECALYPFLYMTKCEELTDETVKFGAIPIFVFLLRDGNDEQKEYAADAFAGQVDHDTHRDAVTQAGIITDLVCLVGVGKDIHKEKAAEALGNIAKSNEGAKEAVDANAIPALITLLSVGDNNQKESAVGALLNLAHHSNEACPQLSTKENVAVLVANVESGEDKVRALATGVLGFIGVNQSTTSAIAKHGGVDALLKAIEDTYVDTEECLMALLNLSKNSVAVCSSVLSEDNAEVLATLAKSEDKSVECLADEIFKQTRDKKSDG